jgi:Ca2+/Na+ antiporter
MKKKNNKNTKIIAKKIRYTYLFLWFFMLFFLTLCFSYFDKSISVTTTVVYLILFIIFFVALVKKYKTPSNIITYNRKVIKIAIAKKILEIKPADIKKISINYYSLSQLIIEIKNSKKLIKIRVKKLEKVVEKLNNIVNKSTRKKIKEA